MSYGSYRFAPNPSPHHHSKSRKLLLCYGIAVLATTTVIILTIYNIMVLRWCANIRRHMPPHYPTANSERSATNPNFDNPNSQIAISSKYKKGQGHSHECAVCLSHFIEEEEVRQLQKCKHLFHTNCIDTWIYNSHLDCPVCRAPVRSPMMWNHMAPDQSENSREVLLLGSATV